MRAQKQQNVTQRKGGIQQEIEYADLCKTIQNSGRWELDSNKRNMNQVFMISFIMPVLLVSKNQLRVIIN